MDSKNGSVAYRILEVVILTVIILVVGGLFLIPTISFGVLSRDPETRSQSCSNNVTYTGDICRNELESSLTCYTGISSPILIPATVDQQQSEADLATFFDGLAIIGPTMECEEEIRDFLCLMRIGLCINETFRSNDNETCMDVRDIICPNEWMIASQFIDLPICEDLPAKERECVANISITNTTETNMDQVLFPNDTACARDFFFDENGTQSCRPTCGEFITRKTIVPKTVISMGYILSLLMLLVIVPVQRKTLLRFPLILPLYTAISALTITTLIVIGYFDNAKIYCSSRDFIHATAEGNETAFCTLTGLTFTYISIQLPYLVLVNAAVIFWGLACPFNYRRLKITGRTCFVHIGIVATALVLPLPFALIHPWKGGFVGVEYPTTVCVGRNRIFNYYFFILPQSIIIGASTVLLVFVFWIIFKTLVLKKNAELVIAAKAELKISIILIYYIVVGVMGLVGLTYSMNNREQIEEDIAEFLICSLSGGLFANCEQFLSGPLSTIHILTDITLIMVSFLPVVLLLFSINLKSCRNCPLVSTRSS